MVSEKMYSIAIRKRAHSNDFFWNHEDFLFDEIRIDCRNRYWLADPFLFEKDGKDYVFYEAFDLIERKGKIGYSVIDGETGPLPIHIVLDEPYHLSFPHLFEYEGSIFMMPETCEDNTIKLFKALSFPDRWEEYQVLLSDIYACDTLVTQDLNNKNYLLASEMYRDQTPNGNYISCWVKNVCYPLNHDLQVEGKGMVVAEGDCGIRNAGNMFVSDGKLYRVGQNCPQKQYGKGLVLFEVESFDPYQEKLLWIRNCEDFASHLHHLEEGDIIGVHTYNASDRYEVIDFSQIRNWKRATLLMKKKSDLTRRTKSFGRRLIRKLKRIVFN